MDECINVRTAVCMVVCVSAAMEVDPNPNPDFGAGADVEVDDDDDDDLDLDVDVNVETRVRVFISALLLERNRMPERTARCRMREKSRTTLLKKRWRARCLV